MHRDFFDAALEGGNGGSKVTHARIVSRLAARRQLRWRHAASDVAARIMILAITVAGREAVASTHRMGQERPRHAPSLRLP